MAGSMDIRRDAVQEVHQGKPLVCIFLTDHQNMPASRGKALPLLRIINAFLRFLPRTPEDLVFRGRVHQFASSVISVADKSAINMRGDYNDIKTTWEEEAKEEQGDEGDIDMDKTDKKEEPEGMSLTFMGI